MHTFFWQPTRAHTHTHAHKQISMGINTLMYTYMNVCVCVWPFFMPHACVPCLACVYLSVFLCQFFFVCFFKLVYRNLVFEVSIECGFLSCTFEFFAPGVKFFSTNSAEVYPKKKNTHTQVSTHTITFSHMQTHWQTLTHKDTRWRLVER